MKRIFVMFAAAGVLAAGAGCASVAKQAFVMPEIHFNDLRVLGAGLTGGTVEMVLSVHNTNPYRLDTSRLTYRLMIDTTTLGEGVYDKRFTVTEGDSSVIRLPVTLDYKALAAAGTQLMGKGTVNYRVMGDVTVSTPAGKFTQPYSQTGQFTTFGGVTR